MTMAMDKLVEENESQDLKNAKEGEEPREEVGGLFTLTEVRTAPKREPIAKPLAVHSKKEEGEEGSSDDGSFRQLSPRAIIERVNNAAKSGEKAHFKGIGLESTRYYKLYMSNQKEEEVHEQRKQEAERYFKNLLPKRRVNEHMLSFNRIKDLLTRSAARKAPTLGVVLKANLDDAYRHLQNDFERVNAYQKYSYNIP